MDKDLVLKAQIITAFEREFAGGCVLEIIRTTLPAIKGNLHAFVLTCKPRECTCTPACRKEIIAMTAGEVVAFIGEEHYDRLQEMAGEVVKAASSSSRRKVEGYY